jgi:hypothetical protein
MGSPTNIGNIGTMLGIAMAHTVPVLKEQGFDPNHFMGLVMEHLSGQGVPGADGLVSAKPLALNTNTEVSSPAVPKVTGGFQLS